MIYITLKSGDHIIYENADTYTNGEHWIEVQIQGRKDKATGIIKYDAVASVNKDCVESVGFEKPTIKRSRRKEVKP